jgi:peptidoglycan-associated lipoprotein
MFRFIKFGLVLLTVVLFSACASTPPEPEPTPAPPPAVEPEPTPAPPETQPIQEQPPVNPLTDPSSILSQRLVFFAFDSYTIEPQFRELVEAHANYMVAHPSATMIVRGHTDERGTHEYNIALGQRRADAVKRVMTLLGVAGARIESVSYGKEQPRNLGHNEAAWAENRRVEIVYVTE